MNDPDVLEGHGFVEGVGVRESKCMAKRRQAAVARLGLHIRRGPDRPQRDGYRYATMHSCHDPRLSGPMTGLNRVDYSKVQESATAWIGQIDARMLVEPGSQAGSHLVHGSRSAWAPQDQLNREADDDLAAVSRIHVREDGAPGHF